MRWPRVLWNRLTCHGSVVKVKIGDMVVCRTQPNLLPPDHGLIVGFNKKGEGGKDFVHVLIEGEIQVFMHFNVAVISGKR